MMPVLHNASSATSSLYCRVYVLSRRYTKDSLTEPSISTNEVESHKLQENQNSSRNWSNNSNWRVIKLSPIMLTRE